MRATPSRRRLFFQPIATVVLVRHTAVVLAALAAICLPSAGTSAAEERLVPSDRGLVVSVSGPAGRLGAEALAQGGNAVDAAIATALGLCVTFPAAGNIGGGGFMIVYPGQGAEPVCIEYRETAPQAATATLYAAGNSQWGHRVVGVPGTVRGLALAHQRFARLPWKSLVMPAAQLAADGFAVDAPLAKSLNRLLADPAMQEFAEFRRVFAAPRSSGWQAGDLLQQPDLAATLKTLAEEGPDSFYRGRLAEQLVAEMQAHNGLITRDDLAQYQAQARKPIHGTYRGYDLYASPPPSSGGTCLVQMLNMLETFDLKSLGPQSPEAVHLVLECMKRAYADRARHLGDPAFTQIPAHLTTKEYARKLAAGIDPRKSTPAESLAPEIALAPEGDSTTHFSIVDGRGMAVSNTYTLQASYGSRVVVRGGGYLLNNEMTDFNWRPGHTDSSGKIGTPPNQIAPGKRMLSSQTPLVVARQGRAVLVTGSPGGRTIINTVLQVTLGVLEHRLDVGAAVDAPRWHHQWLPDRASFEQAGDPKHQALLSALVAKGHQIDQGNRSQGDAHSIWIDPQTGTAYGAADRRILGAVQLPPEKPETPAK